MSKGLIEKYEELTAVIAKVESMPLLMAANSAKQAAKQSADLLGDVIDRVIELENKINGQ
jgi:hypothetical protein